MRRSDDAFKIPLAHSCDRERGLPGYRGNGSLAQALASPEFLAGLTALNMSPMNRTPDAFADVISAATETWAQVVKRANIVSE